MKPTAPCTRRVRGLSSVGEGRVLRTVRRTAWVIGLALILSACAGRRDLFVLLPDPDGKTGAIEVSNQGGSQVVSEANGAAEVKSSTIAPKPAAKMEESQVRAIFGEALKAEPHPPEHFLLYFLNDSTELAPESRPALESVFAAVEHTQPLEITIVGHTDRAGPREANFQLGLERASQIKKLLIARGVNEALIKIQSHGEDNPLVKTEDEVPEPKNRRVEIVIR